MYCALSLCCGRHNARELSRSSGKVVWPWNLVLDILSPSPPSISLDIVVSVGSWFATPLGVDLVSANLCLSCIRGFVVDCEECVSARHASGNSPCCFRNLDP